MNIHQSKRMRLQISAAKRCTKEFKPFRQFYRSTKISFSLVFLFFLLRVICNFLNAELTMKYTQFKIATVNAIFWYEIITLCNQKQIKWLRTTNIIHYINQARLHFTCHQYFLADVIWKIIFRQQKFDIGMLNQIFNLKKNLLFTINDNIVTGLFNSNMIEYCD